MTLTQQGFAKTAESIIKELKKRNIDGYFCETGAKANELVLSMLPEGASIGWGGSETIKECGLMDALNGKNYNLIDRSTAKTDEERREIYAKTVMADAFLMSTNAITVNGELVNIDGASNRVACLLHGPKEVYVLVGMNKVTGSIESAIERIRTYACPANTIRLNRNTPCALTGKCGKCFGDESICSNIVITRRSSYHNRIKVILIAENYGF